MLYHPKQSAPEPYLSGALYLLQMVALYIRNDPAQISPEELSDLGEAIHNIPESLTEYGHYFDEQMIRKDFLARYDEKWSDAHAEGNLSLIKTLDDGIEHAREWLSLDG